MEVVPTAGAGVDMLMQVLDKLATSQQQNADNQAGLQAWVAAHEGRHEEADKRLTEVEMHIEQLNGVTGELQQAAADERQRVKDEREIERRELDELRMQVERMKTGFLRQMVGTGDDTNDPDYHEEEEVEELSARYSKRSRKAQQSPPESGGPEQAAAAGAAVRTAAAAAAAAAENVAAWAAGPVECNVAAAPAGGAAPAGERMLVGKHKCMYFPIGPSDGLPLRFPEDMPLAEMDRLLELFSDVEGGSPLRMKGKAHPTTQYPHYLDARGTRSYISKRQLENARSWKLSQGAGQ